MTPTRNEVALCNMLKRYMAAYPAFRIKPIGAQNSSARLEQELLMNLEESAIALITEIEGEEV